MTRLSNKYLVLVPRTHELLYFILWWTRVRLHDEINSAYGFEMRMGSLVPVATVHAVIHIRIYESAFHLLDRIVAKMNIGDGSPHYQMKRYLCGNNCNIFTASKLVETTGGKQLRE